MKKLFTGVVISILFSTNVLSQIKIENIPPKTNQIELLTELSFEENFTLVGKILVENDFELDQVQKEFGYITTIPKKHARADLTMKFKAVVKPGKVIMSGEFLMPVLGESYSKIQNKGMKGSPLKVTFEELVKIADKIPFTNVNFLVAE